MKLEFPDRFSANVSNNVNADQRFVEQFSYQCSRDVKFPLNMVENNLNNFSGDKNTSSFLQYFKSIGTWGEGLQEPESED
jgi:hypothetical protein